MQDTESFSISPSQMTTLTDCELKWSLQYIKGMKEMHPGHNAVLMSRDGREIEPEFIFNTFGRTVHKWFEKFFSTNYQSSATAANRWNFQWNLVRSRNAVMFDPNSKRTPYEYTRLGRAMAGRFYKEHRDDRLEGLEFEQEFQNIIFRTGGFTVFFRGFRDRIHIEDSGQHVITDYKTGYRHPESKLRQSPQFLGYSVAHEMERGERPRIDVYYPGYDEVPKSVIPLTFTDDDHERFVADLGEIGARRRDVMKRVRDGKKLKPNYGPHCHYCQFSVSGSCDSYNETDKFRRLSVAIIPPTNTTVYRRKPEGQRHFRWYVKDAIIVGNYERGEAPKTKLF